MNRKEAISKYGSVFREDIIESYKDPDRYVYINEDDEDLQKWRIENPSCPDWGRLEGFNKKPFDQIFEYEKYPVRLDNLWDEVEKRVYSQKKSNDSDMSLQRKTHQEMWLTIRSQHNQYQAELNWIQSQWYYRMNGKWFFCNGKPTYITGFHWFFLNYWPLEGTGQLPEYRDRDRKWFLAQDYTYKTTEVPEYEIYFTDSGKEKRRLILLEDGTPKMVDIGYRTLLGTNNLKGRRVGETSKTCAINYCIATDNYDRICGIQGNLESTAEDIYNEKLLYAYNRLPFFFIPEFPNLFTSSGLNFTGYNGRSGLNSKIVYATTAKKEYFDQRRLDFYHGDEIGKTKLENVLDRHGVVKRCCTEGALIKGFMIYTSTAEDMEADSGRLFEKLSEDSMFEERLANGQTKTGLINVYFPIYFGLKGFIDRFGMPIIESPTEEQIPYLEIKKYNEFGRLMGAKEYLESIEKDLIASGDLRGLAQFQRQHPKKFRECFALAIAGNNFNTTILRDRVNELKFQREKKIRIGNFVWEGQALNSRVIFVDDIEGKWKVSHLLPIAMTNQTITYDGMNKMPRFESGFIVSADAYRFDDVDSYRESKGAICVYEMFNETIDGEKKDARDYVTDRFVATYLRREQTKELFAEEVLKVCLYYNALCYPEINVTVVQDLFIRYGYVGYLLFDMDETGNRKKNSGWNTAGPVIKQRMFTYDDTWINLHAHKCDHIELLEECLEIKGPKQTKDYDLFVAMSGCLLGAASKYTEFIKRFGSTEGVDVSGFWGLAN